MRRISTTLRSMSTLVPLSWKPSAACASNDTESCSRRSDCWLCATLRTRTGKRESLRMAARWSPTSSVSRTSQYGLPGQPSSIEMPPEIADRAWTYRWTPVSSCRRSRCAQVALLGHGHREAVHPAIPAGQAAHVRAIGTEPELRALLGVGPEGLGAPLVGRGRSQLAVAEQSHAAQEFGQHHLLSITRSYPLSCAALRLHATGPGVVREGVRGADGRPGAGLAGDRDRRAHADLRPHRLGQDAGRVPVGARPDGGRADRPVARGSSTSPR